MRALRLSTVIIGLLFINAAIMSGAQAGQRESSNFYLGVEGFRDTYKEPSVDLTVKTDYGSITAGYTKTDSNKFFLSAQGRASTGTDEYSSISGNSSGARQYEGDLRALFGQGYYQDGRLRLYSGLGVRYFRDEGKGQVTDLGFLGYDRRIFQVYLPLGASYEMRTKYFSITPKAEIDALLYGNVSSRLQNAGLFNVENRQDAFSGYGLRGEVMLGRDMGNYALQFGPFVRYWDIGDSNLKIDPVGTGWIEPENTRTQIGATARVVW